ncbi:diguanylate cyclase [Alkaliphilus peptidifermentans]|uniref:PAS domain S-box-containing protein/diguanylate cyclase (GGDEF) domain-containing protein n=1 Tax=Alkaliphilus peptidifermentans DSM 18978 TaxID=1120976 RepID=A0A1G5JQP7_9FIRM|nr:diguanylate cyclase [Alkaliphilus peptidifermentans]SCY90713.1 PAS domain S-box-containing protein/diguanylate cyclase (GGDEF) domain-containing protein [Alkaliphilus peptidifermentans DSM 18978]
MRKSIKEIFTISIFISLYNSLEYIGAADYYESSAFIHKSVKPHYINATIFFILALLILVQLIFIIHLLKTIRYNKEALEDSLWKEKEGFKAILLSVEDGIVATDEKGKIRIMNAAAEIITGWKREEALGKELNEVLNIINQYTGEKDMASIESLLKKGNIVDLQKRDMIISKNNNERLIMISISPIEGKRGRAQGIVLVLKDVTDEDIKQEEIKYLSFHDQLTGLYNRRYFDEELKRLDTERNLPLTIVMADVNGLKLTNDAFGHAVGDRLLQETAKIMQEACRSDDIIARLGGDEFVILLPKTSYDDAEKIVERIRCLSSKTKIESLALSISIGWHEKRNMEEKIEDILKKAEDHMYRRKLFESPRMRRETIRNIVQQLAERNQRESEHSRRVSEICEAIGLAMGLSVIEIKELKDLGLYHDIGKVVISDEILDKEGELSEEEWKEIKRHPEIGYRILSSANEMAKIAEYVLAHHENWDGTGYPKGLKGKDIPFQSRILSIANSYDTMISIKPFGRTLSKEEAITELYINAAKKFDPYITRIFIEKVLLNKPD